MFFRARGKPNCPCNHKKQCTTNNASHDASESFSDSKYVLSALQENQYLLADPNNKAPQPPPDEVRVGMLWYLNASIFFVVMSISNKLLGGWGYPVFQMTLFRSMVMAIFCVSALTSAGMLPNYTVCTSALTVVLTR